MGVCCLELSGNIPNMSDACVCNANIGATAVGANGTLWTKVTDSEPCSVDDWIETTPYVFDCTELNTCSIDALADVDLTDISAGDILIYNGTTFGPISPCATLTSCSIGDLGDVNTDIINNGDVLTYNMGVWTPQAPYVFTCSSLDTCSINSLLDVDTATNPPSNGDTFIWNGTTWGPISPCSLLGDCSINDLGDVDTDTAVNGDVLTFNTGVWSAQPAGGFVCSALNACSIDALGDVVITSPVVGATMIWDGANWVDTVFTLTKNQNVASRATFNAATQTLNLPPAIAGRIFGIGINSPVGVGTPIVIANMIADYDTTGGTMATAGQIVIPRTGRYNVSGSWSTDDLVACPEFVLTASLGINGSPTGRFSAPSNVLSDQVQFTLAGQLFTAGDILTIMAYTDCADPALRVTSAWLSAEYIEGT